MPLVRFAAGAVALATALSATPIASPAVSPALGQESPCAVDESGDGRVVRIAGTTRWETAACTSSTSYPDGSDVAILARGDDAGGWADALAGTVLASALDAPVLLTSPQELADATRDELARLGAQSVVVLGGTAAVSPSVVDELTAAGYAVERVAGPSRVDTAIAVAQRAGAGGAAFVVNGWRPADALVAGTTAARRGAALLIAEPGEVPAATLAALRDLHVSEVVIVGGHGVVPAAVEVQLIAALRDPDAVRRISGPSRSDTAAAMARAFPSTDRVHIVAGSDRNLVDAIPASWAAAHTGGSVVYLEGAGVGAGATRYLATATTPATQVTVYGGAAAVSHSALADVVEQVDTVAPEQLRGLWVHLFDGSLKSRHGINQVLDAAVANNYNTIVVQAARRHDAYYDSDVLPRTVDPDMPADLDLLGVLVPAAHARGLAVHAWYSTMPTYHSAYNGLTLPRDHVYVAHGPDSADPWTTQPVSPAYAYLDPGVPGAQDHLVAMLTEVVRRYDVDGVHLDYLRYASTDTGRAPVSLARFDAHGNGNFDDWRRRQTEDIARRIWLEVTAIDPTVVVSMAAIAQGQGPIGSDLDAGFRATRTYVDKFQDWAGWVDKGFIDHVFPMAYMREANAEQAGWYDRWVAFSGHLAARSDQILAVGQGAWLNTIAANVAQTTEALSGSDGVVTYAWQGDSTDGARGDLLRRLGASAFAAPARVPSPSFKTTTPLGHALVDGADDGAIVTATSSAGVRVQVVADATGHAGFVGLTAGAWTFSTSGHRPQPATISSGGRVARVTLMP